MVILAERLENTHDDHSNRDRKSISCSYIGVATQKESLPSSRITSLDSSQRKNMPGPQPHEQSMYPTLFKDTSAAQRRRDARVSEKHLRPPHQPTAHSSQSPSPSQTNVPSSHSLHSSSLPPQHPSRHPTIPPLHPPECPRQP